MDDANGKAVDPVREGLKRRGFLIGGAGLVLPPLTAGAADAALPGIPPGGEIGFGVYRKGLRIGEHRLKFDAGDDGLTITTDVHIAVHIGPVPVYRFTQHIVERWRGDRFMSLECTTGANNSPNKTLARRTSDGIHVEPPSAAPYTSSGDIFPMTHWNRDVYRSGALFNPQDGKAIRVSLASRGDDAVKLNDGTSVRATRWSITGDSVMDEYYDAQGVWTGMHSRVQDGSFVDYRRL